jgi:hypothetical protein
MEIEGLEKYVKEEFATLSKMVALRCVSEVFKEALEGNNVIDKYGIIFEKKGGISMNLDKFDLWVPENFYNILEIMIRVLEI